MDINREQVLVVDDEEDLRKAIVDILTLDGFEVDQAGSAEEAAEKLSQTAYDVLITDHNLPGKTGVELLEESLVDRKSTRLNSSHLVISYAVFCLKKKQSLAFKLTLVVCLSSSVHAPEDHAPSATAETRPCLVKPI